MIKKLEEYSRTLPSDKEPRAIANTMYDVALLQSGFVLNNPIDYYQRAMGFILDDMGISRKDEIREPELDIKVEDFEAENLDDKEL